MCMSRGRCNISLFLVVFLNMTAFSPEVKNLK